MNNKLEVIGIDHGWSMMKTVTQVFVTGVKEITTTPALFGDVLEYDGKYYNSHLQRIHRTRDWTVSWQSRSLYMTQRKRRDRRQLWSRNLP